jgi:DNA-binding HxlR family transcriptional regulator
MILPYPGAKGAAVCRLETVGSGSFLAARKTIPMEALPLAFCPHASLPELGRYFRLYKYRQKSKVLTKSSELESSLEKKQRKLPDSCGLGPALAVIGGKWKALLLWQIHQAQPCRFGELKRLQAEISEKMLIQHLREMEADGIIHREVFHQVPPRVEYSVTPEGAKLDLALAPLAEWGKKHQERTERAKAGAARTAPEPRRKEPRESGRMSAPRSRV